MANAMDCLARLKRAAPNLTDDELDEILTSIQQLADDRKRQPGMFTDAQRFEQAAEEVAREIEIAAQIERRNHFINRRVEKELIDQARLFNDETAARFGQGDPSLGLTAATVGANQFIPGARASVDARGNALMNDYLGGMIADMRRENLLGPMNGRELEREIAMELAELSKRNDAQPGRSGSPEAQKIAKIIHKYRTLAVARENRAGAWIRPLEGYIMRQSHHIGKMRRAGFEEWRDFVVPLLDQERTFKGSPVSDALLRESYNGLVSGEHVRAQGAGEADTMLAFKGPGNLAKKISQHRVLHFRDSDAWMTYNDRFGRGTLIESVFHEFERAARNTALMEKFGPNPRAMFDNVRDKLAQQYRDDPKKVERIRRRSLDNFFDEIDGTTRIPDNWTAASVTANILALQSLSKLGGAGISSISDIGFKAATLTDEGNALSGMLKSITTAVDGLPTKDKMLVGELLGVGLEGHLGSIAARHTAQDDLVGQMSKLQQKFFKLNMLGPWTDANKRGLGMMWARDLAMNRNTAWGDLPQRETMSFYGIDEAKWNVARQATRVADDGREYLFPNEIRNLPDEAFSGLVAGDLLPNARQIAAAKDDIETALRSYLGDMADEAIPTPGARERAILRQGTRPGTPAGIAARLISQFKAFPTTAMTRQFGRRAGADTTKQFFQAMANGTASYQGLAMLVASTTVLGYAAMVGKDLAKNRTPRDPTEWNTWVSAFTQGGGAGIYGDFIFGEFNRFGRSATATLAGPTLGTVDDIAELWARARTGDDVAAQSLRFALQNTPFINLFYIRGPLDHMILYELQEAVNPGYLRRAERRMEKERGQTFFIAP